jgi:hypothetical protein
MRMLDTERGEGISALQLYLTEREAEQLQAHLDELLKSPEAAEHRHLLDGRIDLSLSIVTKSKLQAGRYTAVERALLGLK